MARNMNEVVGRQLHAVFPSGEHDQKNVEQSSPIKGIWSGGAPQMSRRDELLVEEQPTAASTQKRRRIVSEERLIAPAPELVPSVQPAERARDLSDDEPIIELCYDDPWDDLTSTYLGSPEPAGGMYWTPAEQRTREYPASSVEREKLRLMAHLPVQPACGLLPAEIAAKLTTSRNNSKSRIVSWFCLPATALLGGVLCLFAYALIPAAVSAPDLTPAIEISVDKPTLRRAPLGTSSTSGTLWIDCSPSARVFVDNAFVGDTPVRGLQVAPGDHQVRLVDGELRTSKSFELTISPGQTVTRVETLGDP
jgi:hypothetical protein